MEHARSMRLHVVFPLNMWVEAVNIDVYLINRGPSTPLCYGTLEEAWTSKKVSYSFLKIFGCEAFSHIDSNTTLWHKKLGHMSDKGMKVLHSKKVLPGLNCVNMDFCESCVLENKRE